MSKEEEKKYVLKNTKTNLYLKGYKSNKPLWAENEKQAAVYNEMDCLRVQRHLETQCLPYQKVVMIEKSTVR